jgi:hypothetical protein
VTEPVTSHKQHVTQATRHMRYLSHKQRPCQSYTFSLTTFWFLLLFCYIFVSHLSGEEAQLWEKLVLIASDTHPDAVGTRLHISRATSASNVTVPWDMSSELRYAE